MLCLTIFHKGNNVLFLSQIEKGTSMLKKSTTFDEVFGEGRTAPAAWPIPEGVQPFQRGVLSDSGIEVSCYQVGPVVVAVASADLMRLEIMDVKLGDADGIESNLLGFGATEGHAWCSLFIDPSQYEGHSPNELVFQFLTIVDD